MQSGPRGTRQAGRSARRKQCRRRRQGRRYKAPQRSALRVLLCRARVCSAGRPASCRARWSDGMGVRQGTVYESHTLTAGLPARHLQHAQPRARLQASAGPPCCCPPAPQLACRGSSTAAQPHSSSSSSPAGRRTPGPGRTTAPTKRSLRSAPSGCRLALGCRRLQRGSRSSRCRGGQPRGPGTDDRVLALRPGLGCKRLQLAAGGAGLQAALSVTITALYGPHVGDPGHGSSPSPGGPAARRPRSVAGAGGARAARAAAATPAATAGLPRAARVSPRCGTAREHGRTRASAG